MIDCPNCRGSGTVMGMAGQGPDAYGIDVDCHICGGCGAVCPYCTSDNPAIAETYFDQTCDGCLKRMVASPSTATRDK